MHMYRDIYDNITSHYNFIINIDYKLEKKALKLIINFMA